MADLTIRGAGIFGLSIAWEALSRGAHVCVVDPDGVGAGSSGGVVGALQPHAPDPWNAKKQFQLESLRSAKAFWDGVEAVSGMTTGYGRVGRVQPLRSEREVALARARKDAARTNWGDADLWHVTGPFGDGWEPPSPTGLYLRDGISAILNPAHAVASLAAALQSRGGEIRAEAQNTTPTIWATGWQGLQDLGQALGRTIGGGVKGQAALLGHNAAGAAQIYAEGLHILPHLDGTLAIGSTSERDFDDPSATDEQLEDIIARAASLLPVLHGAPVLKRWAGVRPRSPSRAPLLGPWPGRDGHFIANGGFKIGFGMAPKVAKVMVDLILEGVADIPPEFHTDKL